ncbi:hypothetical protein [Winogradskyella sp. 4-2091]|uniref:hypothetical protein n=1 Tax=Winogradskyella sp. 4-2091 TaxID=3381659 RepID=UPI0038923414
MNKIIFFVFIVFQLSVYSQVELGQSSSQTLYLLHHLIKDNPNWEMEKVYKKGDLQEIIIYQNDQTFYDLLLKVDAIQRFVMEDDVYILNILQFPSLKLEALQNKYDNHYKNKRVENYYFDDDFEYHRTIEEVDETASVVYQKTVFDELPKTVQQQINQRKKPEENTDSNVVIEYINPLEKQIRDTYSLCKEKKIVRVDIKQFDKASEYDYKTSSHQTVFCNDNKRVVLDYLIYEGIDGFYYFTFSNMSFNDISQMVINSYNLSFDLNNKQFQKIKDKDPRGYVTAEQQTNNGIRVVEIKSYYDGNLAGDYIKISQNEDGTIQVHIAFNGLI